MTSTYTTVPEVKGYLFDTLLPAAVATLASTITVGTTTVALRPPDVFYGRIAGATAPDSYIIIGPTSGGDATAPASFPSTATRWQTEDYAVQLLIWYRVGDTSNEAQRIATESGYTVYRAIAAQVAASRNLGGVIPAGGHCQFTQITDNDFDMAEGRGIGLVCNLHVTGRI